MQSMYPAGPKTALYFLHLFVCPHVCTYLMHNNYAMYIATWLDSCFEYWCSYFRSVMSLRYWGAEATQMWG